ncbi:MAG: family 78 glycoside hydrolase catalytic domain [Clostridia bacterium]|nr:family 78 glycoside hydrolase catalytic domain [Clostridia bacterium]
MKFMYPTRIVAQENTENTETLLKEKRLQIGLKEQDLFIMKGKSYVILDFGKEVVGGVRILTYKAEESGRVRLRFGESVSETCAELGEKNATNDHALRDFCTELKFYSDIKFGQSGFRFLRVDTLEDCANVQIKSVVVASEVDERPAIGSFECNDMLVNQIWDTAAYTIRLCMQNGYFWDGIKRDRLVWIGDLYPEMRAAHCVFGEVPETENSLDFAQEENPLPGWMNRLPAYSLWWLMILHDEYQISSNKPKFAKYLPYVKELLKQISDCVAVDGEMIYPDNFIDWPTRVLFGKTREEQNDVLAGMAYLTKIAVEKTVAFLQAFAEDTTLCKDILSRVNRKPRKVETFKQIAGLGVWAGDCSENNKRLLLNGGAKGMSTFLSYPILSGVAALGEYETALSMMKEYYGGMLSVGATSFWEDFDLDWLENCNRIDELPKVGKVDIHGDKGAFCYTGFRHSFCHGWSAGVLPYLMETVVGIRLEEIGQKRIKIQPNLSGLKHVKATYPTAWGVLKVEHILKDNGEIETKVDVPQGIEIV